MMPHGAKEKIDLRRADLSHLDLTGFSLEHCDLDRANLAATTLDEATIWQPRKVDFRRIGSHHRMNVVEPEGCNFDGLDLRGCGLRRVRAGCSFRGACLRGLRFEVENGADCDFMDADCAGADLLTSVMTGVKMRRTNLQRARLQLVNLERANLQGADLADAQLACANLRRADLRKANLRGANLADADLVFAKSGGADFTDVVPAILYAQRQPGPRLLQFEREMAPADYCKLTFTLLSPAGLLLPFELDRHGGPWSLTHLTPGRGVGMGWQMPGVRDLLLRLAVVYPTARLLIDTVWFNHSLLTPQGAGPLGLLTLCEVFGLPEPDESALERAREETHARNASRKADLVARLRAGPAGVGDWNSLSQEERQAFGGLTEVDLTGCDLRFLDLAWTRADRADLTRADLRGADLRIVSFRGSCLREADARATRFWHADCYQADAEGIDLRGARMQKTSWRRANLRFANLSGADLSRTCFQRADLRDANLTGVILRRTCYDARTLFPIGYTPGEGWERKGPPGPEGTNA
jgi:uncharacterized protein YjbI with pentapeptide repeats